MRSTQTTFDTVLNKRLRFSDTRLVLNRGFQEVTKNTSKSITANKSRLQFDKADSRVRVNKLAALLSTEPGHFSLPLLVTRNNTSECRQSSKLWRNVSTGTIKKSGTKSFNLKWYHLQELGTDLQKP